MTLSTVKEPIIMDNEILNNEEEEETSILTLTDEWKKSNQREYVVNKQVRESNYRYIYHLRPIGYTLSFKYNF